MTTRRTHISLAIDFLRIRCGSTTRNFYLIYDNDNLEKVLYIQVKVHANITAFMISHCILYQLIVKSKPSSPMTVHFMVLRGPFGDTRVDPHICQFEFTEGNTESPFFALPLPDSAECNKLLAARIIDFRYVWHVKTQDLFLHSSGILESAK